jgi:diguanylate cyclase (GGDEF)-like protein
MNASSAVSTVAATDPGLWPVLGQTLLALARRQGAMVAVKDAATLRYVQVDAALAALLGRELADVAGRTDAELFDPALAQTLRSADQTALGHGDALESEHRFEWKGERREFAVLRLAAAAGERRLICCIWQDLAPRRQREAQLKAALDQLEREQRAHEALRRELADQSLRDNATGLYTRAHFEDQLRREVDLSTREHREFAMVFIELDPFDARVAAAGEQAPGRILEAMGRLLRGNTRAMDASCRLDERRFAVLLSGVGLATAHSRMEGLRRQCVTQIVVQDGRELGFTVSMGVASFPHTAHTQQEINAACEAALAEAKKRGGNAVALASIRFEPV